MISELENFGQDINGTAGHDQRVGTALSERIQGFAGDDTLIGGNGQDTLIGDDGDDVILGGGDTLDLRDVVFAGADDDSIDGGYGNDELRGDLVGEAGDDVLTGSALSDEIFGNDGFDFINGGFGSDRLNGGADGDRFFHLGVAGHGSDWIQDYNAAEGDVLFYGGGVGAATASDCLVQRANTANAGSAAIDEVFITHIPSGNLLWALVDGDAQTSITIQIDGQVVDFLV